MSCTVVSLLQWNLACDILINLAIKWVHNLPPHLSYVSTLPDITQKPKSYVVFLSIVWLGLKRTGVGGSEMALKRADIVARCSKWRPFAFTHAHSCVCHWSMTSAVMPWWIRCQVSMSLCFSFSVSCFDFNFCVMSGSVET